MPRTFGHFNRIPTSLSLKFWKQGKKVAENFYVKMQASSLISLSPSFNSYSSCKLTEIAARVVEELRNGSDIDYDDFYAHDDESVLEEEFNVKPVEQTQAEEEEEEQDEKDFEFSFVCREPEDLTIPADEIFYNGQIRPVFPLFNTDLLLGDDESNELKPRRVSLKNLMTEDRELPSCSSSEVDDLEGLPPGTYCVWKPKKETEVEEESTGICKKSNSIGSSKRWRFRDLLHRSNSDGKDTFVFFTPNAKVKKSEEKIEKSVSISEGNFTGTPKTMKHPVTGDFPAVPGYKARYIGNRITKRQSFLPYRQDLLGFFSNV